MITIRNAGAFDLADLITLTHQLGYHPTDDALAENFQNLTTNPDAFLYVARYEEEIAGYFSLHILRWFHSQHNAARLSALIVDIKYRRHGVGKAMVAYAEQIARANQCDQMEISSSLGRKQGGTFEFYEALGYKNAAKDSIYFRKSFY